MDVLQLLFGLDIQKDVAGLVNQLFAFLKGLLFGALGLSTASS